jgi:hypothetical protein
MTINPDIIEILACPKCGGDLIIVPDDKGYGCRACNLLYKNEDDIPNFLIEEAINLSENS